MRKYLLVIGSMMLICFSFASSRFEISPKHPNAAGIYITVGKGKSISLLELSRISRSDLEKLTGRKMNFFQRVVFKGVKHKLQNGIGDDGAFADRKLEK